MNAVSLAEWLILFVLSALAATVALYLYGAFLMRRDKAGDAAAPAPSLQESCFLFEREDMIGQDMQSLPPDHPARSALFWEELRDTLSDRFSGIPDTLQMLPENSRVVLHGEGATLDMLRRGDRTRIILAESMTVTQAAQAWPGAGQEAMRALTAAPDPIWRTDHDGTVLWQNDSCKNLFEDAGTRARMSAPPDTVQTGGDTRICITPPHGGTRRWYDIHHVQSGDHVLHFARDMTQVIHAETVQRDFVQTLTKTFANLTTGLAIFDKTRRLALFNPALLDLTGVQVAVLSARPDLMDFFDRLREAQIMPEPRNYADWRAQIRDAVSQANSGLYQDLWSLPNGLTYRITGRPHPDGAIAFLFEDISAEISLTRRFRTQIELRQSVLDKLDVAVAVFAPNNLLMFCNTPCTDLLRMDPDKSFADMSLRDFLAATRATLGDSPGLRGFGARLLGAETRSGETTVIPLADGRWASCRVAPLAGGARMLIMDLTQDAVAPRQVAHVS